ncbi:hypothetical protein D3C80_1421740 [compost metagenome]
MIEKRRRMPCINIVNFFVFRIDHKINRCKIILNQLVFDMQLIKSAIQLLNHLFRLNIGIHDIFQYRGDEHAEQ